MKKILVTGINSYIGNAFREYMEAYADEDAVEGISMRDGTWRDADFSRYDVIFHVAGIAHADSGKITEERRAAYYAVNRDLTAEAAEKAKREGVGQFIFMSSAIVYGDSAPIGKRKRITSATEPSPAGAYGDSKLQAERAILPLSDANFKVAVLRPPMIYGKGSKGNYPVLASLARKLPVFPDTANERSVLYIGNLTEFVRLIIKNGDSGIFFPQNAEYAGTAQLVKLISAAHGKKTVLVRGFSPLLKGMSALTPLVNKAFGSLSYDMSMSTYSEDYRRYSLEESIKLTEN